MLFDLFFTYFIIRLCEEFPNQTLNLTFFICLTKRLFGRIIYG